MLSCSLPAYMLCDMCNEMKNKNKDVSGCVLHFVLLETLTAQSVSTEIEHCKNSVCYNFQMVEVVAICKTKRRICYVYILRNHID